MLFTFPSTEIASPLLVFPFGANQNASARNGGGKNARNDGGKNAYNDGGKNARDDG